MRESDRIYGGRTAASGGIGRKVGETRKNSWRGGSRSRVSAGEGLQGTATRHEWKMEQGFTEKHPPPLPPRLEGPYISRNAMSAWRCIGLRQALMINEAGNDCSDVI